MLTSDTTVLVSLLCLTAFAVHCVCGKYPLCYLLVVVGFLFSLTFNILLFEYTTTYLLITELKGISAVYSFDFFVCLFFRLAIIQ